MSGMTPERPAREVDLFAALDVDECPRCGLSCECPPGDQPEIMRLRAEVERLTAEHTELTQLYGQAMRERDDARAELRQADEFGRGEFRVTAWAYEQAVRVMEQAKTERDAARAERDRLLGLITDYTAGRTAAIEQADAARAELAGLRGRIEHLAHRLDDPALLDDDLHEPFADIARRLRAALTPVPAVPARAAVERPEAVPGDPGSTVIAALSDALRQAQDTLAWIYGLGDPDDPAGVAARRIVTLDDITRRAGQALGLPTEPTNGRPEGVPGE